MSRFGRTPRVLRDAEIIPKLVGVMMPL